MAGKDDEGQNSHARVHHLSSSLTTRSNLHNGTSNSSKIVENDISYLIDCLKKSEQYLHQIKWLQAREDNQKIKPCVQEILLITQEIKEKCILLNTMQMTEQQSKRIKKLTEYADQQSSKAKEIQLSLLPEFPMPSVKKNPENLALNENNTNTNNLPCIKSNNLPNMNMNTALLQQELKKIHVQAKTTFNNFGCYIIDSIDTDKKEIKHHRVEISPDGKVSAPNFQLTSPDSEKLLMAKTMVAAYIASGHSQKDLVDIKTSDPIMQKALEKELKEAGFKPKPFEPEQQTKSTENTEPDNPRQFSMNK